MKDFLYFADQIGTTYLRKGRVIKNIVCHASKDGVNWYRISNKTHADLLAHNKELKERHLAK